MSELSTLDERLAEIDERLRALQSEFDGTDDPDGSPTGDVPAFGDRLDALAMAPTAPAPSPPAPAPPRVTLETPAPPAPAPTPLRSVESPPAAPAAAPPASSEGVLGRLHELSEAHERLLDLHRELLSQYAELLARRVDEAGAVPLVAGPFTDAAALRAFQRDLESLPGVTEVTTREFPGGDRVALDVRLAGR